MKYPLAQFAAYSCGTYGSSTYSSDCHTSTGGDTPSPAPNGPLGDTGYNIIIPVAFALAIIIAGGMYLVRRFLRRRSSV